MQRIEVSQETFQEMCMATVEKQQDKILKVNLDELRNYGPSNPDLVIKLDDLITNHLLKENHDPDHCLRQILSSIGCVAFSWLAQFMTIGILSEFDNKKGTKCTTSEHTS